MVGLGFWCYVVDIGSYEMVFPNGIVFIVKLRKKVVIAKVNL